jgi:hypothetical protein
MMIPLVKVSRIMSGRISARQIQRTGEAGLKAVLGSSR